MKCTETEIQGLSIIEPKVFSDERGFFLESYSQRDFEALGITTAFVQDNHSLSTKKGTLRGLHFQMLPFSQTKLVRVIRGAVYDVVVDLRKNSTTYLQWVGVELSDKNFLMLYIPKGCAHGFCTLEENTEFLYKTDIFYEPSSERTIAWNDASLKIKWPVHDPIVSKKDSQGLSLHTFISPF